MTFILEKYVCYEWQIPLKQEGGLRLNPYDKAHELARSIRASDVFERAAKSKMAIDSDESALRMVQDFKRRQFQMQAKQMAGQTLTEDEMTQLQKLTEVIQLNNDVRNYLQADMELQVMLMDVQQILAEVMNEVSVLSLEQMYEEMGRLE